MLLKTKVFTTLLAVEISTPNASITSLTENSSLLDTKSYIAFVKKIYVLPTDALIEDWVLPQFIEPKFDFLLTISNFFIHCIFQSYYLLYNVIIIRRIKIIYQVICGRTIFILTLTDKLNIFSFSIYCIKDVNILSILRTLSNFGLQITKSII